MSKPTEAELAQMALQFMARVQMQGAEADAFMAVRAWLLSKQNGAPDVISITDPDPTPDDHHQKPAPRSLKGA